METTRRAKNKVNKFLEAVVECLMDCNTGWTRKSNALVVKVMKSAWKAAPKRGAFLKWMKNFQHGDWRGPIALLQYINEEVFETGSASERKNKSFHEKAGASQVCFLLPCSEFFPLSRAASVAILPSALFCGNDRGAD